MHYVGHGAISKVFRITKFVPLIYEIRFRSTERGEARSGGGVLHIGSRAVRDRDAAELAHLHVSFFASLCLGCFGTLGFYAFVRVWVPHGQV